jgi:hypothetical protein
MVAGMRGLIIQEMSQALTDPHSSPRDSGIIAYVPMIQKYNLDDSVRLGEICWQA